MGWLGQLFCRFPATAMRRHKTYVAASKPDIAHGFAGRVLNKMVFFPHIFQPQHSSPQVQPQWGPHGWYYTTPPQATLAQVIKIIFLFHPSEQRTKYYVVVCVSDDALSSIHCDGDNCTAGTTSSAGINCLPLSAIKIYTQNYMVVLCFR